MTASLRISYPKIREPNVDVTKSVVPSGDQPQVQGLAAPLSALPKKVWGFLAGLLDRLDADLGLDGEGCERALISVVLLGEGSDDRHGLSP